jgi:hypothetical protein
LQAPAQGGLGVGKHVIGHSVRRNDLGFVRDAKVLENLDCVLHGVPVGAGTHDDANKRLCHWVLLVIKPEF